MRAAIQQYNYEYLCVINLFLGESECNNDYVLIELLLSLELCC